MTAFPPPLPQPIPLNDPPDALPSHGQFQHPVDAPMPTELPEPVRAELDRIANGAQQPAETAPVPSLSSRIETLEREANQTYEEAALLAMNSAQRFRIAFIPILSGIAAQANYVHNAVGGLRVNDLRGLEPMLDQVADCFETAAARLRIAASVNEKAEAAE